MEKSDAPSELELSELSHRHTTSGGGSKDTLDSIDSQIEL